MNETTTKGSIRVDLRRNRIIITKKAHRLMGEPEYILLLVNPDDRTLVIANSDEKERRAQRICRNKCSEIELHSKGLLKTLLTLSDNWKDDHSYKIFGEVLQDQNVMKFNIDDAVLASEVREDNNVD